MLFDGVKLRNIPLLSAGLLLFYSLGPAQGQDSESICEVLPPEVPCEEEVQAPEGSDFSVFDMVGVLENGLVKYISNDGLSAQFVVDIDLENNDLLPGQRWDFGLVRLGGLFISTNDSNAFLFSVEKDIAGNSSFIFTNLISGNEYYYSQDMDDRFNVGFTWRKVGFQNAFSVRVSTDNFSDLYTTYARGFMDRFLFGGIGGHGQVNSSQSPSITITYSPFQ